MVVGVRCSPRPRRAGTLERGSCFPAARGRPKVPSPPVTGPQLSGSPPLPFLRLLALLQGLTAVPVPPPFFSPSPPPSSPGPRPGGLPGKPSPWAVVSRGNRVLVQTLERFGWANRRSLCRCLMSVRYFQLKPCAFLL